jgi:hypothetical protein
MRPGGADGSFGADRSLDAALTTPAAGCEPLAVDARCDQRQPQRSGRCAARSTVGGTKRAPDNTHPLPRFSLDPPTPAPSDISDGRREQALSFIRQLPSGLWQNGLGRDRAL